MARYGTSSVVRQQVNRADKPGKYRALVTNVKFDDGGEDGSPHVAMTLHTIVGPSGPDSVLYVSLYFTEKSIGITCEAAEHLGLMARTEDGRFVGPNGEYEIDTDWFMSLADNEVCGDFRVQRGTDKRGNPTENLKLHFAEIYSASDPRCASWPCSPTKSSSGNNGNGNIVDYDV